MPSKYQLTVSMANEVTKDISSNPKRYMDFLVTAANNYKYTFREQLLIYAQKPDAIACADVETWNKLGRWVNKGTKGIALVVDRASPYKLRHVFDITDTNSFYGNEVRLWTMKPEYENAVSDTLANSFGEIEYHGLFEKQLAEYAGIVVGDNISDYVSQLIENRNDSFLEDLDEHTVEVWYRELLKNSVGFMLLTRCGYNPYEIYSAENFRYITNFNTEKTIGIFGSSVSDISEMILKEIGETVRTAEHEADKNRTFAENRGNEYHFNEDKNAERSDNNGTDLQRGGRLSSPESRTAGEPEGGQIWNAASFVSQKPQEGTVYGDDALGRTEQSPRKSGPGSIRDDGDLDETDGKGTESNREPESRKSDALGTDDDEYQELGGGNSSERTDLRLTEPIPTVEEQQQHIAEAEVVDTSAFVISQEEIDAVLTRGSGVCDGKYRIYEQYLKKETPEEYCNAQK